MFACVVQLLRLVPNCDMLWISLSKLEGYWPNLDTGEWSYNWKYVFFYSIEYVIPRDKKGSLRLFLHGSKQPKLEKQMVFS